MSTKSEEFSLRSRKIIRSILCITTILYQSLNFYEPNFSSFYSYKSLINPCTVDLNGWSLNVYDGELFQLEFNYHIIMLFSSVVINLVVNSVLAVHITAGKNDKKYHWMSEFLLNRQSICIAIHTKIHSPHIFFCNFTRLAVHLFCIQLDFTGTEPWFLN